MRWYLVDGRTGMVVSHVDSDLQPRLAGWPADRYHPDPDPPQTPLRRYREWLEHDHQETTR